MKRIIGITAAAAVIALLGFSVMPATTYTYVVRELSQTFTAVQTFGAGMAVSTGQHVLIDGASGNSYLMYDADTACWQEWKDGVLGWQLCSDYVVIPTCSTTSTTPPLGGICKDPVSGHNKIRGAWEVIP